MTNKTSNLKPQTSNFQKGHILIFTLIILSILLILTGVSLNLVHTERNLVQNSHEDKQAIYLAEAGLDQAIRQLNTNSNYAGESNVTLGDGTYTIVVSGSGSSRTIEATGYVPNSNDPQATKKLKAEATLDGDNVEFFYGIQVDGGGMNMSNNSRVNGNLFSNGSISGSNGSTITGDAIVAGGLADEPTLEYPTGCTTSCGNADQFFSTASTNRDIAQSFTATATGTLPKISVYLAKVGNPTSNLTVRITTDVSGRPNTSSLANGAIVYTAVGITPSWIDVTFSSPANLTNSTKYWIVLDYGSNSSTNYWNWRKDSTDAYANNTGKYSANWTSGTWTNVSGDLAFRAWIGGSVTEISGLTINGTGRANQFVNTTCGVTCSVENPAPQALPISDGIIQDWKDDATAGGTVNGYSLTNGASGSLGPKMVIGDLSLSNTAILTLTGTVYVTGNINLSNGCQVNLEAGYGTNSGILLTDGTVNISNNCAFQGAGVGSYVLLLTTRDATGSVSINISNNSNGVIYYAGKSRISFSNNATAKEATAWGIDLSNGATITYESGLADSIFSSGPGGGWTIKPGSWRAAD